MPKLGDTFSLWYGWKDGFKISQVMFPPKGEFRHKGLPAAHMFSRHMSDSDPIPSYLGRFHLLKTVFVPEIPMIFFPGMIHEDPICSQLKAATFC